jgi:hypothetical protein
LCGLDFNISVQILGKSAKKYLLPLIPGRIAVCWQYGYSVSLRFQRVQSMDNL